MFDQGGGVDPYCVAAQCDSESILLLLPTALVEQIAADHVILYHPSRHTRLQLSRAAYDLLRSFARPIRVGEVLPADERRRRVAKRCVNYLSAKGFLVRAEEISASPANEAARRANHCADASTSP